MSSSPRDFQHTKECTEDHLPSTCGKPCGCQGGWDVLNIIIDTCNKIRSKDDKDGN